MNQIFHVHFHELCVCVVTKMNHRHTVHEILRNKSDIETHKRGWIDDPFVEDRFEVSKSSFQRSTFSTVKVQSRTLCDNIVQ